MTVNIQPKPLDHRIENWPFNACMCGWEVLRSLECVDLAAYADLYMNRRYMVDGAATHCAIIDCEILFTIIEGVLHG